jgi:ABC-2 type transport system permease protein
MINRNLKLWAKGFSLRVSAEMTYRTAFILLVLSIMIGDLIGPFVAIIIYNVSSGIPGWSLMEFILFQGITIFVFGMWHAFFGGISWGTAELVEEGELERILLRPFNPLIYISAIYIDFHGLAEVLVGLVLILLVIIKLQLFGIMLIPFVMLMALALVFMLSLSIIIAALSIIFVNVESLQEIIWIANSVASYPITIYTKGVKFMLTFIIPAAIASYWPAAIVLGKEAIGNLVLAVIPVVIFFVFSLWLWHFALKKYQSAGG